MLCPVSHQMYITLEFYPLSCTVILHTTIERNALSYLLAYHIWSYFFACYVCVFPHFEMGHACSFFNRLKHAQVTLMLKASHLMLPSVILLYNRSMSFIVQTGCLSMFIQPHGKCMVSVTIRFWLDDSLPLILCAGGLPTVCSACCFSNKASSSLSPSHPLLPLRQRQKKTQPGDENSGKHTNSLKVIGVLMWLLTLKLAKTVISYKYFISVLIGKFAQVIFQPNSPFTLQAIWSHSLVTFGQHEL